MLKRVGKSLLCSVLERQVNRLRKNNDFKIVAVGGSVGKTSTKLAIAKTLSASNKVIYQDGNYNDRLTVPLVLFNETQPAIFNIPAWLLLLRRTSKASKTGFAYNIAVLELGTDAPGQMEKFAYLEPDIYVLSSVAPEHMEYFKTLDAVAKEELKPIKFSKTTLINIDDVPEKYLSDQNFISYGLSDKADYSTVSSQSLDLLGQRLNLRLPGQKTIKLQVPVLGVQGTKFVLSALAVAHQLEIKIDDIEKGLKSIKSAPGRMQILPGTKGSVLIDDTYNSSPVAVKAALDVLYESGAVQKIAILGSMNEMGEASAQMHEEIGEYCDPVELDTLVTVGDQAALYLASAALRKGCKVVSFLNPYEAGDWVKKNLKDKAVILAKGSQNGVFAEEALKQLLANSSDQKKLVRQSDIWLKIKHKQFKSL